MEKNYKELIEEYKFHYKRVNGREFVSPDGSEEPKEQWRIDLFRKAIEIYKNLPSHNTK